jgi:hypothetical protein
MQPLHLPKVSLHTLSPATSIKENKFPLWAYWQMYEWGWIHVYSWVCAHDCIDECIHACMNRSMHVPIVCNVCLYRCMHGCMYVPSVSSGVVKSKSVTRTMRYSFSKRSIAKVFMTMVGISCKRSPLMNFSGHVKAFAKWSKMLQMFLPFQGSTLDSDFDISLLYALHHVYSDPQIKHI